MRKVRLNKNSNQKASSIQSASDTPEFETGDKECSLIEGIGDELIESKNSGKFQEEETGLQRAKRLIMKPVRYGDPVEHGTRTYRKQPKS